MKLILFENLFKPCQLYLQPQNSVLSNLVSSFLVCSLIFIEYKLSKEPSFAEKQGSFLLSIPSLKA